MKRHDFRIIDMWESDTGEKIEFVYLLSWPNKDAMHSRWASFLADQEWIDIKKKTAAESGVLVREAAGQPLIRVSRSDEHTSELQSLMRSSYAVFCFNTKLPPNRHHTHAR